MRTRLTSPLVRHVGLWVIASCGLPGPLLAQALPQCPRCELRLDTILTLGSLDGTGAEFITPQSPVAIDAVGRILIGPAMGIGQFAVFSPEGDFLRYVGRNGEGPGEYRFIFDIAAKDDWIHVFDPMLGRRTLLDTTFTVVRTDLVPDQILRAKALESGRVTFFGKLTTPGRAGFLIHSLDPDGTMESLARPETEYPGRQERHAFGTDGYRAWTAPQLRSYSISEWNLADDRLVRTMSFDSSWFAEWNDGDYPGPVVIDFQAKGPRLLVVGATVDPRVAGDRVSPGHESPPRGPLNEILDGVLELIDLESERVLASLKVDGFVRGFVSHDWTVSIYRQTPEGIPLLDIARVEWAIPPGHE
ncbi:MAG: hypothetical protein KJO44_04440 [Gemmatimonadetes bacterium]|nr:hypothetical protein [Gemmatimonadota bacterium]